MKGAKTIILIILLLIMTFLSIEEYIKTYNPILEQETIDPELIDIMLPQDGKITPYINGCPSRLLNVRGKLMFSNLMGIGVIHENIEEDLSCIVYDKGNKTIYNLCNRTVEFVYCFMREDK